MPTHSPASTPGTAKDDPVYDNDSVVASAVRSREARVDKKLLELGAQMSKFERRCSEFEGTVKGLGEEVHQQLVKAHGLDTRTLEMRHQLEDLLTQKVADLETLQQEERRKLEQRVTLKITNLDASCQGMLAKYKKEEGLVQEQSQQYESRMEQLSEEVRKHAVFADQTLGVLKESFQNMLAKIGNIEQRTESRLAPLEAAVAAVGREPALERWMESRLAPLEAAVAAVGREPALERWMESRLAPLEAAVETGRDAALERRMESRLAQLEAAVATGRDAAPRFGTLSVVTQFDRRSRESFPSSPPSPVVSEAGGVPSRIAALEVELKKAVGTLNNLGEAVIALRSDASQRALLGEDTSKLVQGVQATESECAALRQRLEQRVQAMDRLLQKAEGVVTSRRH